MPALILLSVILQSKLIVLGLILAATAFFCAAFLEVYIRVFVHEPWMDRVIVASPLINKPAAAVLPNSSSVYERLLNDYLAVSSDDEPVRTIKKTKSHKTKRHPQTGSEIPAQMSANVPASVAAPTSNNLNTSPVVVPVVDNLPLPSIDNDDVPIHSLLDTVPAPVSIDTDQDEINTPEEFNAVPEEVAVFLQQQQQHRKQSTPAVKGSGKASVTVEPAARARVPVQLALPSPTPAKLFESPSGALESIPTSVIDGCALAMQPIAPLSSSVDILKVMSTLNKIIDTASKRLLLPKAEAAMLKSLQKSFASQMQPNQDLQSKAAETIGAWNTLVANVRSSTSLNWSVYLRMDSITQLNEYFRQQASITGADFYTSAAAPIKLSLPAGGFGSTLPFVEISDAITSKDYLSRLAQAAQTLSGNDNQAFGVPVSNISLDNDPLIGASQFSSTEAYQVAFFSILYNMLAHSVNVQVRSQKPSQLRPR